MKRFQILHKFLIEIQEIAKKDSTSQNEMSFFLLEKLKANDIYSRTCIKEIEMTGNKYFTTIALIGEWHFRHFWSCDIFMRCQKQNDFSFLILDWHNIQEAPKRSSYTWKRNWILAHLKRFSWFLSTYLIESFISLNTWLGILRCLTDLIWFILYRTFFFMVNSKLAWIWKLQIWHFSLWNRFLHKLPFHHTQNLCLECKVGIWEWNSFIKWIFHTQQEFSPRRNSRLSCYYECYLLIFIIRFVSRG